MCNRVSSVIARLTVGTAIHSFCVACFHFIGPPPPVPNLVIDFVVLEFHTLPRLRGQSLMCQTLAGNVSAFNLAVYINSSIPLGNGVKAACLRARRGKIAVQQVPFLI